MRLSEIIEFPLIFHKTIFFQNSPRGFFKEKKKTFLIAIYLFFLKHVLLMPL